MNRKGKKTKSWQGGDTLRRLFRSKSAIFGMTLIFLPVQPHSFQPQGSKADFLMGAPVRNG